MVYTLSDKDFPRKPVYLSCLFALVGLLGVIHRYATVAVCQFYVGFPAVANSACQCSADLFTILGKNPS